MRTTEPEVNHSSKLTAAAVAKLKPEANRRTIPDGAVPGLCLIIQPSGYKSWHLRYRRPGDARGIKDDITLGPVDEGKDTGAAPVLGSPLTLSGARAVAIDLN